MKNTIRFISSRVVLLLLLCSTVLHAQAQTHIARSVTVNANCGGYYEYLPAGYAASSQKFPLLISFHGAGSYGNGTTELNEVLRENAAYYINNNQFPSSFTVNGQTSSFIVISPQWRDYASVSDINSLINYLLAQNYKIDAGRIYLMGYSMGADQIIKYATNSLANSNRLAGMVTIAPYINPYTDAGANNIANASLPFWSLHSNADQSSPVSWSVNFVNRINSFNPAIPAILTRFDGVTHNNSSVFASNPAYKVGGYNIYEWMLRYRRNYPPDANAGADVAISLPTTSVTLSGTASSDPENTTLTFNWQKLNGPGSQTIATPTAATTTINGFVAGTYNFILTVTDAAGLFDRDTVRVTVTNPNPNLLPQANAGADATIEYPASTYQLNATNSSDNDGVIVSYQWTKLSGPTSYSISAANSATPQISQLRKGIYEMELTVTDNEGGVSKDVVLITVVNLNPNVAPVANAGADQVLTLPTNTSILNGASSADIDGVITQYRWRQIDGPGTANIANTSAVQTGISNLLQGSYRFELRVTDDSAAVAFDTIRVMVNAPPPVVTKQIKVNLFGGTNPQTTEGWNNWNVGGSKVSNRSISALTYADGTASTVGATLSYSEAVSDNGASYGGTMCPPAVLRYTTYATVSRTLTISGLAAGKTYALELYASRNNTGNSTRFTINGTTQTVLTDGNKTNRVIFSNLTTSNGNITVTIARVNTYSYLNGFMLTETTAITGNLAPVANAGPDASIAMPTNSVSLSGASSYDQDGSITNYAWSKISGPASFSISNPNIVNPVISNLEAGTYEMQLMVTDNSGAADLDTMQVTVFPPDPLAPTANAGSDGAFTLPLTSFTLNGTASSDVDGTISSYHWEQFEGPAGSFIVNANQAIATVENPLTGRYGFELTVTDNDGLSGKDSVYILIGTNPFAPPAVIDSLNCGKRVRIVVMGSSTAMGTGASVPDSNWVSKFRKYVRSFNPANEVINIATSSRTTYHLLNPNGFVPPEGRPVPDTLRNITKALSYNPDIIIINLPSNDVALNYTLAEQQANYERTLALTDAAGITVWVTTTQPRTALNAGQRNNLMVVRDWTYQRFGNKAIDFWTDLANPDGTIVDAYNVDGVHVNNMGHHLLYTRVVGERILDGFCLQGNIAPIVDAGADQTIIAPVSSVTLNGVATDTDGSISSVAWRQVSGPVTTTIATPASANTNVNNLQPGTYQFELSATDNQSAVGRDTVVILVRRAANELPIAHAGNDTTITLPVSSVQLRGSGVDNDGAIVSFAWRQVDGPSSANFSAVNIASPVVSGLIVGSYLFELTVTDDSATTATDIVAIQVNPRINTAPIVEAGANINIQLPTTSVQLNGTVNDAENNVQQISWTIQSGPTGAVITNANATSTTVSNLVVGTYLLRLTATDDEAATASDSVWITLSTRPNTAPVVEAGANVSITLPINSVQLNGTVNDAENNVQQISWTVRSGPAGAVIANANAATTSVSNLVVGTYLFRLTATDAEAATGADSVWVTVNPQPTTTTRQIKVNLFGGTNPQTTEGWNNWNVGGSKVSNRLSGALNYADGGVSAVSATLSYSEAISDNGATYGGTMCPPAVLRYTTYATVNRTLTISGLVSGRTYNIELYASRSNTGNSTRFTINGASQTVLTDNNKTNKVEFTNLTTSTGTIVVSFARVNTYNYLNGFTITEISQAPIGGANTTQFASTAPIRLETEAMLNEAQTPTDALVLYPNPSVGSTTMLKWKHAYKGMVTVKLLTQTGQQVQQVSLQKWQPVLQHTLQTSSLPAGAYWIVIEANGIVVKRMLLKNRL